MENETRKNGGIAPWIATVALATILAFAAGYVFGRPTNSLAATRQVATTGTVTGLGQGAPSDVKTSVDFSEFWLLWKTLKEKYYQQPIDDQKLMYGAMAGMAAGVGDPYTVYFEPTGAKSFADQLQGKFEGIGAEIGMKDNQLQVIAPLAGSPAEKAGIHAGDAILAIDKAETSDMSVDKAVSLIRGKKGTTVTLKIGRFNVDKTTNGKTKQTPQVLDITITRDTIEIKSVQSKMLRDNIAYIQITNFNEDTADLFSKAVADVMTKDPKGVVLDLRNDPGGYLDRAVSVAGEWVNDLTVVSERQQGKITESFRGTGQNRLRDMPTIVLVNQGSASASEIVAGALQDYKKAKLVGMKTFGKGSVQDLIDLPDHSAVKVTIAEWVTPTERSINKTGITPDVQVDITNDDANAGRDPQLDKALEILTGKPSPKTPVQKAGTGKTK
jgi:carboxyl-terminal processing protease